MQVLDANEIVKLAANISAASTAEQAALILEELAKAIRQSEKDESDDFNIRMNINKHGEVYWNIGNDLVQVKVLFQDQDI
jgi:hypothetical protein